MACVSCGTGGCGKSNACHSCGTMNVFDWLNNMSAPGVLFDVYEVKFKGGRKDYYRNVNNLQLEIGDPIVVEAQPGHHIGYVTLTGELVRLQLKKREIDYNDDLKVVYRKATPRDLEKFEQAHNREMTTMFRAREIIRDQKLEMKLSDVEYQADNTKATFFYSAEDRVDFRELIKILAREFKIRVEMRQISLRQEASRLGGIGSCGRELCCSTWLSDFKSVSTSAARYQNLSLNPGKLSGQCGRLKCCLNYELETYMEALEYFPQVEEPLKTQKGEGYLQKTDIFKGLMWFGFKDDNIWHPITIERVKEIQELNTKGVKVYSLESDYEEEEDDEVPEAMNSDLDKLDKKFKGKPKRKKKKPNNKKNPQNRSNDKNNQGEQNNNKPANKNNRGGAQKKQGNRNKPANQKEAQSGPKKDTPNNKQGGNTNNKPTNNPQKNRNNNRKNTAIKDKVEKPNQENKPKTKPKNPRGGKGNKSPRNEGEQGGNQPPRRNKSHNQRRNVTKKTDNKDNKGNTV